MALEALRGGAPTPLEALEIGLLEQAAAAQAKRAPKHSPPAAALPTGPFDSPPGAR